MYPALPVTQQPVPSQPLSPQRPAVQDDHTQLPDNRSNVHAVKLTLNKVNFYYGASQALFNIDIEIMKNQVTSFIGPSGCGKSTLLRCLNRLNDLIEGARVEGAMLLDGVDINGPDVDITDLRKRVGMVFQKSNPFPKSIYENVAYGPRLHGIRNRGQLDQIVEEGLKGKRPSSKERIRSFRRATATALYRPSACSQAGCLADGRTLFGAGPCGHSENRRIAFLLETRADSHHCHTQYATGSPGIRLDGIYVPW
jgi:ABC-type uncharacterized transport system YnjBCD ATPase subunit